jgi:hypothetical protein
MGKTCSICNCEDEGAIQVCLACYNSKAVILNKMKALALGILSAIIIYGKQFPIPWVCDMDKVWALKKYIEEMDRLGWVLPIEDPEDPEAV